MVLCLTTRTIRNIEGALLARVKELPQLGDEDGEVRIRKNMEGRRGTMPRKIVANPKG